MNYFSLRINMTVDLLKSETKPSIYLEVLIYLIYPILVDLLKFMYLDNSFIWITIFYPFSKTNLFDT